MSDNNKINNTNQNTSKAPQNEAIIKESAKPIIVKSSDQTHDFSKHLE